VTENSEISECKSEAPFISVPSREILLKQIVEAVSCGTPVVLEGPIGCGKTKLVEHLSRSQ